MRAAVALLVSLALNGAAAGLVARDVALRRGGRAATPVSLAPLPAREWSANRVIREPERRAEPPPPERGQVVELSPGQRTAEAPPPNARFLSERNTRAEHETVARDEGPPGAGRRAAAPGASALAPGERTARRARTLPPAARASRRAEGLALSPAPDGELARRSAGAPGATPGGAAPRAPDLSVDEGALARIAGAGAEHVEGVDEGDETFLDSREFRYATFLNQMRREIGDVWYPRVRAVVRGRDPEGSAIFYRERTVVLAVTLGASGEVRALSVLRSSDVDFVDAIAVASVREAQPFANPPRAMFEGAEEVRIPFAFTIYPADRGGALRWRAPLR